MVFRSSNAVSDVHDAARAKGPTRVRAVVRVTVMALCVLMLAAGCGSLFLHTVRAEAEAVDEVRSIGRVVAQTTEDPQYRDTIQIDDILMLDMNATTFDTATDEACRLLERRGWVLTDKVPSHHLRMASTRWEDTSLTIYPFDQANSPNSLQQRVAEAVNIAPMARNKYILVVVTRA
ncbi:hypothetical protein ABZ907_01290 [Nonomuraea wenchangensis]